jgi:hypothetical protein
MTTEEIIDYLAEYSHDMPGVSLTYFIGPVNPYIRLGIISIEHTAYTCINLSNSPITEEILNKVIAYFLPRVKDRNPAWKPKVIK